MKNNILINIFVVIFVFLTYFFIQPMGGILYHYITDDEYSLKRVHISPQNPHGVFRKDKTEEKFIIHPGIKKNYIAIFSFKQNCSVLLQLGVRDTGKGSHVDLKILHNHKLLVQKRVVPKEKIELELKILQGDRLKIIVEANKDYLHDFAELKLYTKSTMKEFENFIVPFLFSLFFVFLINKNYLYTALNGFLIFSIMIIAEKINFGVLAFKTLLMYMLLTFASSFLFIIFYQYLAQYNKKKLATFLSYIFAFILYSIPISLILYNLTFHDPISENALYALFQTNFNEAYEFLWDFINFKEILLFVMITFLTGFFLYKQEKQEQKEIEISLLIFIVMTFLSLVFTHISELRIINFLQQGMQKYNFEVEKFKELEQKRKTGEIDFSASKKHLGETYVVIIGESLNRKHMGIYNYFRETTPLLSQMKKNNELLIFSNVYANYVQTHKVLSQVLTEANQYNHKNYFESLSIIDVLKKAGFETYWITNQTLYGAWDNMVSAIGTSADHVVPFNHLIGKQYKGQRLDGVMLKVIENILEEKTAKNRVLFIHLMGSHIHYSSRYPHKKFHKFRDLLEGYYGLKASRNKTINEYDNSILYNDYVVGSILETLKKQRGVRGFLYFSDHADDAIGRLAHYPDDARFNYYMTIVPMIIWLSDEYKKLYPQRYENLVHHRDLLFSNDMLYDTMLGIFGVETQKYDPQYDLSSKKYKLKEKDALVLHGKRKYIEKSNSIYWQQHNGLYLVQNHLSQKIIPEHVNSVGKAYDIINDHLKSFELDVICDGKQLFMGKNIAHKGLDLESFLKKINIKQLKKLYLRIRYLDQTNIKQVAILLDELDKRYGLKKRLILEPLSNVDISLLKQSGWMLSYRLKEVSSIHKKQLKLFQYVSFSREVYKKNKRYIDHLPKQIKWITWYAPDLYDPDFIKKIQNDELVKDKKVEIILTKYYSQFEL